MSSNLRIYDSVRKVPQEAIKPITAGRLKGMSDINPMWRIKKLTETFGPCGEGWYYTKPEYQYVPGQGGTIACIAQTSIVYRKTDGWSEPIPGTGGSMFVAQEKSGLYTDDEAPKKALTDALSVACKALGIGADVYWNADRTKYSEPVQPAPKPQKKPEDIEPMQQPDPAQKRMATAKQIEFIVNHSDDQTYENAMMAFGANLEKMSYKQAEKLIERMNAIMPEDERYAETV